jgi:hypothetical protein
VNWGPKGSLVPEVPHGWRIEQLDPMEAQEECTFFRGGCCKDFKTASQEKVFEPTQDSLGRDDIEEYAFVVVLQVGQIVGEVGEVVADADLHVLAEAMINRSQRAAAGLIEIR